MAQPSRTKANQGKALAPSATPIARGSAVRSQLGDDALA